MSNATGLLRATFPTVDSTGPSISGRVFQVTVASSQLQFVMVWILPPEGPAAAASFTDWSWSRAEPTLRPPRPATRTRRKVCLAELESTARVVAVPNFVVALPAFTVASASTQAPGQTGGGTTGMHAPPTQRSPVVQALPSSQRTPSV